MTRWVYLKIYWVIAKAFSIISIFFIRLINRRRLFRYVTFYQISYKYFLFILLDKPVDQFRFLNFIFLVPLFSDPNFKFSESANINNFLLISTISSLWRSTFSSSCWWRRWWWWWCRWWWWWGMRASYRSPPPSPRTTAGGTLVLSQWS